MGSESTSAAPADRLTLDQLVAAIRRLPPGLEQARAVAAFAKRYEGRTSAGRDPAQRRKYAGDPWAYIADVFGYPATPQQEEALALMEAHDRVLLPSANDLGKTWLLGEYAVYYMDAVGAQLDEDTGGEQGARVLLPGPDHPTIRATIYNKMLLMAERAEARGFKMPGRRSLDSVLWRVRPEWEVEAFSPPRQVGQEVAHTASGRHHRNQIALIEEGQGVSERVWRAAEGMCASRGNKIISSFNPTEASGPTYQRSRRNYIVMHWDAFEHPNVVQRKIVIEGAVDYLVTDDRVRECRDRGPYPGTQPDATYGDFIYAAPTVEETRAGLVERGPREDGILGHPDATPHVWRPTGAFEAQVRGRWPKSSDTGLFNPGAWDAGVERWLSGQDPVILPDRIGVDAAREGGDDCCYCPAWGETSAALLRAHHQAQKDGDSRLLEELRISRRVRVGEIRVAPKGDGPLVAEAIFKVYPSSPWVVDEGSVGTSVLDHAAKVLGASASGISFSGKRPDRIPGERLVYNMRASLYVRAALLLDLGLADPPDDPLLREEVLAHEIVKWEAVTVKESPGGKKETKYAARVLEKAEVKKKIGRSPDRADAFVLALAPAKAKGRGLIW